MRIKNTTLNLTIGIMVLFITTILSFILSKIFITNLGIEYNGLNGIFNNIIAILSISELGIAGSINYALYKPIFNKDYEKIVSLMNFFKKVYRIIGILILVLALVVTIFIPVFIKANNFNDDYIRFVFILFAVNSSISYFFSYNRTLIYAYQENYIVTIIDFIFRTLKTFLQLFLLIKLKSYFLFLLINILFTFLNNVAIHILAQKKYGKITRNSINLDKDTKIEIYSSIKKLSIVQVMSTLINFTDNLIISSLIGLSSVGLYINYNIIITQLNAIINTVFNGIGASLGNLLAENQIKRISVVVYNLEYFCFFISLFCTVCLMFLTQPFIASIWLGEQYLLSSTFLFIIIANLYLSIQRQLINYYLRMSGYFKDIVFPIVIEAIINLIVSVFLGLKIGLIGVVIGTLISSAIGYVLTSVKYNLYVNQKNITYWKRQLKFLCIIAVNIIIVYLIVLIVTINNEFLNFFFLGLVCVVICLLNILIIIITNKKLEIYKNVFYKFLRRKKYETV